MKFKRLLILPLLLLTVSSCKEDTTDYGTIDFDEKDYICQGGSYGGFFLDVNVGRYLASGSEYEFIFRSSYSVDTSYTINISKPQLAEYQMITSDSFNLITKNATGDFILKIENAKGLLVYRNVIRVRKPYTPEEMGEALYNVDKYVTPSGYGGYLGDFRLSFTSANPIEGSLTGGDDYEQDIRITFSMTFDEYIPAYDAYGFVVTEISSSASYTKLTYINVARCLDSIYLYDSNGLLTILQAQL